MVLLTGAYTIDMGPEVPGRARGISAFDFSPKTGHLQHRGGIEMVNPSYLYVDQARHLVYAVRECPASEGAGISAFRVVRSKGNNVAFEPWGTIDLQGDHPCHLERVEDTLLVSCYGSGSLHVVGLDADGRPDQHLQRVGLNCQGPDAHAHCTAYDAKRGRVYLCDLGCDRLRVFDRLADGTLRHLPDLDVRFAEHSGPRHCLLYPDGDWLLVNCEHLGRVALFDLRSGAPKECLNVPSLPERAIEGASGAAIRIDAQGKYLYISERNYSVITGLRLEMTEPPKLQIRDTFPSGGKRPRDIALSPDGKWLLAANLQDHNLAIFRKGTGGFLQLQRVIRNVKSPAALAWVPGI